jgi:hypothetical protein
LLELQPHKAIQARIIKIDCRRFDWVGHVSRRKAARTRVQPNQNYYTANKVWTFGLLKWVLDQLRVEPGSTPPPTFTVWLNNRFSRYVMSLQAAGFRRRLFLKLPKLDHCRVFGVLKLLLHKSLIHRFAQAWRVGDPNTGIPICTANQNISPKSTAPQSHSLKSIGCSGSTLPGNFLPRISQLT